MEEAPLVAANAVEAVAAAANNFFNNPLSAVQPNVFQNIIPGVKPAIEYLLYQKLGGTIALWRDLRRNIPIFFEDLKKSKAVIAGGFVLAAIELVPFLNSLKELQERPDARSPDVLRQISDVEYKIGSISRRVSDIDIYVNIDQFPFVFDRAFDSNIVGYFRGLRSGYMKYRSSIYCQSFLRRNGIKAVHRYLYKDDHTNFHFDVMAIRNKRTPIQVVNNFDLTFCQAWFDGEDCYATFPDHIAKKEGWVQKDYLPLLFRGNRFIKNRIRKYVNRGYKIIENPELTPELAKQILLESSKNLMRFYPQLCDSTTTPLKRYEDPAFLRKWAIRMLVDYLALYNIPKSRATGYFKPLVVDYKTNMSSSRHNVPDIMGLKTHIRTYHEYEFLGTNPDDGYDTEDYDQPDLKDFKTALLNFTEDLPIAEGIPHDTATEDDKTLLFYRLGNELLAFLYKEEPRLFDYLTKDLGETLVDVTEEVFDVAPQLKTASKEYLTALRNLCIRKAPEDYLFASEGDEVFDFHTHKMDQAISAENLEGYLTQFMKEADHSSVPCYLQNSKDPANSCEKRITFDTIRYIVSPEFYKKYTAPPLIKTGLNQSIASLNSTLENTKSPDPVGFGDIYHFTMCPFCLQLENRDEGCAYMTHANPQRLDEEHAPYCLPQFVVPEIREKYMNAARTAMEDQGLEGVPAHLEFCIECGRPCVNHDHFDLNDPPNLLPPMNPGICSGGKRVELFARILAVRGVYRDSGILDPKTERLTAALAADAAPHNADLMARAQVIADMPPAERIWGNADVPARKMYNDPAYRDVRDNNNAGSNAGSENSFNAAAYGFENEAKVAEEDAPAAEGGKRKKSKGYRLTRKLGKQLYKKSKATKRR